MEFYQNLKKNIQINNAKNINLISKGIANKKGIKKIYININSEGATSFLRTNKKENIVIEQVRVDTFKNILFSLKCKINYLIIDIEGYEYLILNEAIKNNIEFIMFECLPKERTLRYYKKLLPLINQNVYQFYKINRDTKLNIISSYNEFLMSENFNFILSKRKLVN